MKFKKVWFNKAYSSHGKWTTFEEICELEQDRDNEPFVDYSDSEIEKYKDCPSLWITVDPWEAFMYFIYASEVEIPKKELEKDYPNWKKEIVEIDCEGYYVLEDSEDGDGGYLILDLSKKTEE